MAKKNVYDELHELENILDNFGIEIPRILSASISATTETVSAFRAAADSVNYDSDYGTNKADVMRGTTKSDLQWGKGGNDTLIGKNSTDLLIGGAGNDLMKGGLGDDTLWGQKGNDTYVISGGYDIVIAGDVDLDTFKFIDQGRETYIVKGDGEIACYTPDDVFIDGSQTYRWGDLKDLPHTFVSDGAIIHFRNGDILLDDFRNLDTFEF